MKCYQCEKNTNWLAPDSRCKDCTSYTPDEVRGVVPVGDPDGRVCAWLRKKQKA